MSFFRMVIACIVVTSLPVFSFAASLGISTPGTNVYPDGMVRYVSEIGYEGNFSGVATDWSNHYAYAVTGHGGSAVVKFRLGDGSTSVTRVGSVAMGTDEEDLVGAAVDQVNGYGYFTSTTPYSGSYSRLIKVRLGTGDTLPERIGAVQLTSTEQYPGPIWLDVANGYGYAAFNAAIMKFSLGTGDALPTRIGATTFPGPSYPTMDMEYDPEGNFLLLATYNGATTYLRRFTLGAGLPTLATTLSLPATEMGSAVCMTYDSAGDVAFLSVRNASGTQSAVVRVNASTMTRDGSSGFTATGHPYGDLAWDPVDGLLYATGQGTAMKFSPGSSGVGPSLQASAPLGPWERQFRNLVADPASRLVYCFGSEYEGRVVQLGMTSGAAAPTRLFGIVTPSLPGPIVSAAIDEATNYIYCGTSGNPGVVLKLRLNDEITAPELVGRLELNSGEGNLKALALDTTNKYAYFGTGGSITPAKVIKVALGTGDAPPTRVGTLTLPATYSFLGAGTVDPANGHVYMLEDGFPDTNVAKIAMNGGGVPTLTSQSTITGFQHGNQIEFDAVNNRLYVGSSEGPTACASAGAGASPPGTFTVVPKDAFEDECNGIRYISSQNRVLVASYPDRLTKRSTSLVRQTPGVSSSMGFRSMDVDTSLNKIYLGGYRSFSVYDINAATVIPSRLGHIVLPQQYGWCDQTMVHELNHRAYLVPGLRGGYNVVKYATSQSGAIWATKLTVTAPAIVNSVKFYSHAAGGGLNLGIYRENAGDKEWLWECNVTNNLVVNNWVSIDIASGGAPVTPPVVNLTPGTYWLAWQTQGNGAIGSFVDGEPGDGWQMNAYYGGFPDDVADSDVTYTDKRWAIYLDAQSVPDMTALTIADADGANSPSAGFTNNPTVNVNWAATDSPTGLEISEAADFSASTVYGSGASPVSFTLSATEGLHTIYARAANGYGNGPSRTATVTLDTTPPTGTVASLVTASGSPALSGSFSDAHLLIDISNFSIVVADQTRTPNQLIGGNWTIDAGRFSTIAQGIHDVVVTTSDMAGNLGTDSTTNELTVDQSAPTSSASAAPLQVGDRITGTYLADDSLSSVTIVRVYLRKTDASWAMAGLAGGGKFSVPVTGSGATYYVQTAAQDVAGNSEVNPFGTTGNGDATVQSNPVANGSFSTNVSSSILGQDLEFPMEQDPGGASVTVRFSEISGSGTLTVRRYETLPSEVNVLDPGKLIGEYLQLSASGLTSYTASLTWKFQNSNGLDVSQMTQAYRFSGGVLAGSQACTVNGDTITIDNVTSFSNWYVGDPLATVRDVSIWSF